MDTFAVPKNLIPAMQAISYAKRSEAERESEFQKIKRRLSMKVNYCFICHSSISHKVLLILLLFIIPGQPPVLPPSQPEPLLLLFCDQSRVLPVDDALPEERMGAHVKELHQDEEEHIVG